MRTCQRFPVKHRGRPAAGFRHGHLGVLKSVDLKGEGFVWVVQTKSKANGRPEADQKRPL